MRVHMLTSDLGLTAKRARLEGRGLRRQETVLFHPVKPMLAERTSDLPSALRELGEERRSRWRSTALACRYASSTTGGCATGVRQDWFFDLATLRLRQTKRYDL